MLERISRMSAKKTIWFLFVCCCFGHESINVECERTKWNVLRGPRWCLKIIFYFSHCFLVFPSFFFICHVVSLEICFIGFLFGLVAGRKRKGRDRKRSGEKLLVKNCHFQRMLDFLDNKREVWCRDGNWKFFLLNVRRRFIKNLWKIWILFDFRLIKL